MKKILSLSLLIMLASIAGFADVPRPPVANIIADPTPRNTPKPKQVSTTMSIRMDSKTKVATLSIPKEQLRQLTAQLEQMDSDDTAATTGSFSRTQTIVSGMFLSLAMVFGGIWFVRNGKSATKAGKTLVIFAVIAGVGSAATLVFANAGPPPALRSITSSLFDKKAFIYMSSANGKINLEVSDQSSVELRVPAPANWPLDKDKDKEDE